MKSKIDALMDLLCEARSKRATQTGARRAVRAAKVLGLDDAETRHLMYWLDYCDNDGKPYRNDLERVWP